MKIWVTVALVAVLGAIVGAGWSVYDLTRAPDLFEPYGKAEIPKKFQSPKKLVPAPGELADGAPKAQVIGPSDYDFGSMERLSTRSHTFKIKNIGTAPLELIKGNTTCKCTLSSLSGSTFEPGEIAEVTLEWTSKTSGEEDEFSQIAEIHTNDPEQPILRLKIHGVIAESIRVLPRKLVVNRVLSNEGTTTEFRLYGFQTEKIDVTKVTYENARLAKYFDLKFKPMSKAEYQQEKGAICGAVATLRIKPGLPLGPLEQKLLLRVKIKGEKEATLEIPIEGSVTGDIVVTGAPKYYVAARNVLNFGTLKKGTGKKAVLFIFVKGPHRRDVKFGVGEMDPPNYFRVHFSKPQELNHGKTIKYLLNIEIPPDAAVADHLGYKLREMGRIIITTTHPETHEIPIYVHFAVEENSAS